MVDSKGADWTVEQYDAQGNHVATLGAMYRPRMFDERFWMPGIALPTLLPARSRDARTLASVDGHTFVGVGAGERVYVIAQQHRRPHWGRVVVCVLPEHPRILFHIRQSQYTIG